MTTTQDTTNAAVRELAVAVVGYGGFLVVLGTAIGLHPLAWSTGAACGIVGLVLLGRALHRSPLRELGPANRVTLVRAGLTGGVAALVAESCTAGAVDPLLLAVPAGVAVALDWVDGRVARRTGTTSSLGARFDMESDAFLILVLSVHVAGVLGAVWVLAIGSLRYVFVATSWVLPWLSAPLPPSHARKVVAAVQAVVLVIVTAGVLPTTPAIAAVALSLAALVASFGRDAGHLWRDR